MPIEDRQQRPIAKRFGKVHCWRLAALLGITPLPRRTGRSHRREQLTCHCWERRRLRHVTDLRRRGPAGRYHLSKLHTPSRRDSQQISRPPDDIFIEFVGVAVGINNFPHHLNELTSAIIVQHLVELAGKVIEINCAAIDDECFFEQAPGGVIIERELRLQDGVEGFSSRLRHVAIDSSNAREQRRGREPKIVIIGL